MWRPRGCEQKNSLGEIIPPDGLVLGVRCGIGQRGLRVCKVIVASVSLSSHSYPLPCRGARKSSNRVIVRGRETSGLRHPSRMSSIADATKETVS